MEQDKMNLSQLKLNDIGIINKINCNAGIKRRLLDLGLTKGTKIVPVFKSPSGDPRAFAVRGSIIAVRKEDAEKIEINRKSISISSTYAFLDKYYHFGVKYNM